MRLDTEAGWGRTSCDRLWSMDRLGSRLDVGEPKSLKSGWPPSRLLERTETPKPGSTPTGGEVKSMFWSRTAGCGCIGRRSNSRLDSLDSCA
jgi:hypothetical protein